MGGEQIALRGWLLQDKQDLELREASLEEGTASWRERDVLDELKDGHGADHRENSDTRWGWTTSPGALTLFMLGVFSPRETESQ